MLNLIPLPYRMIALAAIAAALVAFGWAKGAGSVHDRWDSDNAARMNAAFVAEQQFRAKEHSMQQQLNEATNAAAERETKLRADYAAANAAALGLRNNIATLRNKLSVATVEACRSTAESALVVFSECADKYQSVAEDADRFGSGAKTLDDAWPK